MARLRVSSGTVWRRSGGRRGPEPALALDSAELGLPWGVDAAPPAAPDPQPPVTLSAPVRRRYAAAVYALSLAFVPLVAATTTTAAPGVQGGGTARANQTRQYLAVAAPVLVPAAAGEPITLDKWKGTAPDRLQPRPHRPQPAGVAPIVVPDTTTPSPALAWAGTFPAAVRPPARSLPLGGEVLVSPPAPPTVDLSWLPQGAPVGRRTGIIPGPAWVAPLFVPDVTQPSPALSWRPVAPDRVWGRARVAELPQAVAPAFVPDVTTPAPLLSWAARLPDSVRLGRRTLAPALAAPIVIPAPATPEALDWWQPSALLQRTPRVSPTGGSVGPLVPLVSAPPDVLPAATFRPVRAGLRPLGGPVAPLYVPDVTAPVPALSWQPSGLVVVRRGVLRPLPALSAPVTVPAVVPPLSWHAPGGGGRPRLRALVVPTISGPVEGWRVPTDWRPHAPDRLFARPRPFTLGSGVVEPIPPATPDTATAPAVQGGETPWRPLDGQYQWVAAPVVVPTPVVVPWFAAELPPPVRRSTPPNGTLGVLAPVVTTPAPETAVAPAAQGGIVPWSNADRQYPASVEPFVPAIVPAPLGWYPVVPLAPARRVGRPTGSVVAPVVVVPPPVSVSWLPLVAAPGRLVRRPGSGLPSVVVVGAEPPGEFWPCEMWQYLPGTPGYAFDPVPTLQWVQAATASVYTFDADTQTWVMLPSHQMWEW